ncbi:hypothetical protein HOC80_01120 [archaeon]|jgi:hypothetical protein|nr:hypothetical protein [archaeon]MBT4416684.1 hypothetical protein [archaeon]
MTQETEPEKPNFSTYQAIHDANERYEEMPSELTEEVNKVIKDHCDSADWRKGGDLADKIYDTTREFVLGSVDIKSSEVSAGFLENTITQILGKNKGELEYDLRQKADQYTPDVAEDASDEEKEKAVKEAKKKYKTAAEGEVREVSQRAGSFYKQEIAGRLGTLTTEDIGGFQGFIVQELRKAKRTDAADELENSKFSRISTLTSMYEDQFALVLKYSRIVDDLEATIKSKIKAEAD